MEISSRSLSEQIQSAMKSGDRRRVTVLRMLSTSLKNAEVAKMSELTRDETLAVVSREVKRRHEAAEGFEKGGRSDRAEEERAEAEILMSFLPAQLSDEELQDLVRQAVQEVGATTPQQMGEVMRVLMPKVAGRADGKVVSSMVRDSLT